MTDFWSLSRPDQFAYIFNRTALGMGVLIAAYSFYVGNYVRGAGLLALVPIYFWLHAKVDAP